MARFARDCLEVLGEQLAALEKHLGPGTASLAMRIGLHSGAVTAGVLRGERARFQVGDCAALSLTIVPINQKLTVTCPWPCSCLGTV
jgi:hypothetical protein